LRNMPTPESGPQARPGDKQTLRPDQAKQAIIASYPFVLALENCQITDYVSEKVVDGLKAGTLPIYSGAPNILEFLPHPSSVVRADDFNSPKELADELVRLVLNTTAYAAYFRWKKVPSSAWTTPKTLRIRRPGGCRHCNRTWLCAACLTAQGATYEELNR
jgi:hypothetical protein